MYKFSEGFPKTPDFESPEFLARQLWESPAYAKNVRRDGTVDYSTYYLGDEKRLAYMEKMARNGVKPSLLIKHVHDYKEYSEVYARVRAEMNNSKNTDDGMGAR